MSEPQTYVIDENISVISHIQDPLAYVITDDDALPPPSPVIPLPHLTEDQIRGGLITASEKLLIDGATTLPTPNTLVLRDNMGNILGATSGVAEYEFDFPTPLLVWTITHNLHRYPEALVLDDTGEEIIPDIEYTSIDVITITHGRPYSGRVILT
jgi:hypothetical protein